MTGSESAEPGTGRTGPSGGSAPLKVIAVGASAGGLEPLERLFASLPDDTGCAFVVVQHLSPTFRSLMDGLLARHTGMRIRHLENGMTLERDCIHLNTPRSVATLVGARVEVEASACRITAGRPIDALFRSLAEAYGERALVVVLSGTGSDGRLGCERIAERGGTVLVQFPPDARFDGMPRGVVDAGLADATAPADKLGERVIRWIGGRAAVHDVDASLHLGVPVALCLTDEGGRITEVNDEWLDHLEREREASIGTPFVDLLEASDRARAAAAIDEGFAKGLPLRVRGKDGRAVEHEMSCRTRTIGTLVDGRLIVLTDVSGRHRAMDELESRNRDLTLANANLEQFAFVASHDLQEPLRKIRQFSGFLLEDDRDALSEDGRYHLRVIVGAAERMSTLIRDLLQYSRASRNALDREHVALDAVLAQVRDDLGLPLAESCATLGVESLPGVSGDPVLLLQLFTNLVGNALKYRDPGRALRVDVRHERRDGRSRILVEDNGIGFDPHYARKVFEPFTPPARRRGPSWQRHRTGHLRDRLPQARLDHRGRRTSGRGGHVLDHARPDRRPAARSRSGERRLNASGPPVANDVARDESRPRLGRRVVLMVDDDEEDAYLTRRAFRDHASVDVFHHVADGAALFAYLRAEGEYRDREAWPRPRLILMDINMPRENGFALLTRLRGDASLAPIPVIMLSTSMAEADIDRSYRLGANSFIAKPVTVEGLRDVARHVDGFWFETALTP